MIKHSTFQKGREGLPGSGPSGIVYYIVPKLFSCQKIYLNLNMIYILIKIKISIYINIYI